MSSSPQNLNLPAPSKAGLLAAHLAEAGWLGLLIVVPLVMNVAAARTFEAAKLAGAVPLAALLFLVLLATLAERQARLPAGAARQPALWAFAALTLCAITATVMSDTPWIAFFGDYFRREGLVSWLIYAIVFFAVLLLLRQRDQLERVIDTLLLVSVIPCIYALQQRFGYDFFSTAGLLGGTAGARPGSNLGNPTFLSAYLLLIIPVTIARLVNTAEGWRARAPWLALLALQLFAAILTQSRGPLLGLVAVLFLLAVTLGALLNLRSLIVVALGAGALTVAALLALNLTPDLQAFVKNTPLQRFIFTGGQDLTANSRIGIWGMGTDAFLHQPLWRQLIGSGPDATHFNYFPYLPAWVMRIEGLTETIDRLHGETMETVMTLGLAGLAAQLILLSSLVWLAVSRLASGSPANASGSAPDGHRSAVSGAGGRPAWGAAAGFALACVALSLATGYGFMVVGGAPGLFSIGAGIGIAVAWSGALLLAAARMAGRSPALGRADTVLLVALACALIGSWVEAQVGVPTISTRLLNALYAALILLLGIEVFTLRTVPAADGTPQTRPPAAPDAAHAAAPSAAPARKRKRARSPAGQTAADAVVRQRNQRFTLAGWITGLGLCVVTAAYFPPLSGNVIYPPSPQRLHLIIVPLLWFIVSGAVLAIYEARRVEAAAIDALTRFLMWMVLPWFGFLVIYAQFGGAIAGAGDASVGERINALLMFSFGAYGLIAVAAGVALYFVDPLRRLAARGTVAGYVLLAASVPALAGAWWTAMIDVRADTYAKLANWAQSKGRLEVATEFFRTAADMVPQERRFTGSYAARLIERASQDLNAMQANPALVPGVLERLAKAQAAIEQAQRVAPHDPWVTFANANVNQFQGLSVLEKYQPKDARAKYVAQAEELFALGRKQFPGHPWILRNWAQLDIDLGKRPAAYQKFDAMEKLDPLNTSMYTERLRFTRAFGDHAIAVDALRRGIAAQPPGSPGELELREELAKYFAQTGQPQQALNEWSDILRARPDNFSIAGNIAETYLQLGQRELALGNAQAALVRLATTPRSPATDAARARLEGVMARIQGAAAAPARAGAPGTRAGTGSAPNVPVPPAQTQTAPRAAPGAALGASAAAR